MRGDGRPGTGGEPFERRLATILMADIVGYSRMMEANEERTLRVFRGHREIFDAMLVQHRGRMFNTAGDAVLAEFPSAVDAVRCATEIQSALRTRNDHLSPDERMQFRIGVNLGDVIVRGTDLLGDGVNVAARIQTAAGPAASAYRKRLRPDPQQALARVPLDGRAHVQEHHAAGARVLDRRRGRAGRDARGPGCGRRGAGTRPGALRAPGRRSRPSWSGSRRGGAGWWYDAGSRGEGGRSRARRRRRDGRPSGRVRRRRAPQGRGGGGRAHAASGKRGSRPNSKPRS
ncbi:MAG: adenylate/guanylate cyclase domain-containing protein [Betaproteobacteria bacterium]|nr:adenylate/guanylate cyclase domain-containing protein [Betaproteobacteria bacterium]